jgi:ubiquinone/menaquinone biosynthesis C-methylase UbiE
MRLKPQKLLSRIPLLKHAIRGLYRPGWYRSNHGPFEELYRTVRDPWNFETSHYEQRRLRTLLKSVRTYPHDTVLEVGCGEGLFTAQLGSIARDLVAIDVSETALERARKRYPRASYIKAGLEDFQTDRTFDIIVCAETLYYIQDVAHAIDKMTRLGRYCLVSYLSRETKNLDSYFTDLPEVRFERHRIRDGLIPRSITIVVWKGVA